MIKFTVMIPTRERCATLAYTLESCISQQWDNLEIIVSDNASLDQTHAVVAAFDDPRIRYVNTVRRKSITGNFEFALTHATGEYMMYLGDDDGLTPDALRRVAEIIGETGQSAIVSSQALYHWPNALDEAARDRLVFSTRKGYEIRSTRKALQSVLDFEMPYTELPGAYAGFVSRRSIEAAMFRGLYFHSITPDAYSGIVNAAVLDSYAYVHSPFAIAGLSGRSNGASHFSAKDSREASLYERENDIPFHPSLRFCPSNEIVMAEAFLQASEHLPSLKALRIDLGRVCDMALREASSLNYSRVQEGVGEIRERHHLRHRTHAVKPYGLRARSTARRLIRGLRRIRGHYKILNCAEFGVADVQGAGKLMNTITAYIQLGYASPRRSLARWLERL